MERSFWCALLLTLQLLLSCASAATRHLAPSNSGEQLIQTECSSLFGLSYVPIRFLPIPFRVLETRRARKYEPPGLLLTVLPQLFQARD